MIGAVYLSFVDIPGKTFVLDVLNSCFTCSMTTCVCVNGWMCCCLGQDALAKEILMRLSWLKKDWIK